MRKREGGEGERGRGRWERERKSCSERQTDRKNKKDDQKKLTNIQENRDWQNQPNSYIHKKDIANNDRN